jgi:ATP-dependent helicase YprA (DUF1998 family)
MNVFDLDRALVSDYERFARSFTQIRALDIHRQVEALYASDRFWPEPLISINPRFERGATVDRLVADGSLHEATARVFSLDGKPLPLYRHQAQAVAKATTGQSFVVTTGTGSGKSLCFFIPIIDAAIRARAAGEPPRTRAIVIYPMNALANSQREEIDKFIKQSGLPDHLKPTFARYTGQESLEDRTRVREAKPDILLTNFMMLELLLTRNGLDRAVIANAYGLNFLVLDELHTYRGRQGADVRPPSLHCSITCGMDWQLRRTRSIPRRSRRWQDLLNHSAPSTLRHSASDLQIGGGRSRVRCG